MIDPADLSFENRVRTEGFDASPEPHHWYYVSSVDRESGRFAGAFIIEAESWVKATLKVYGIAEGAIVKFSTEIPADRLPEESYRNRRLTREEVEEIWPGTKESAANG
jgi:hypothetical protein